MERIQACQGKCKNKKLKATGRISARNFFFVDVGMSNHET